MENNELDRLRSTPMIQHNAEGKTPLDLQKVATLLFPFVSSSSFHSVPFIRVFCLHSQLPHSRDDDDWVLAELHHLIFNYFASVNDENFSFC